MLSHRQKTRQCWRQSNALIATVVALLLLVPPMSGVTQEATPEPDPKTGVTTYTEYDGEFSPHVMGEVLYAQVPPVGGPHNGVWQNCGFYTEPVHNWNAVHTLEHGAVWITYDPELPEEDIAQLEALATQSYLLISPYPQLGDPVVASSWGRQVRLDGVEDPRLQQFINEYRQNPDTAPEPGALCSLGTDATMNPGETPQTEPAEVSGTPAANPAVEPQSPATPEGAGAEPGETAKDSN